MIATTGTGGDLFPGIAVAESLRSHGVEKIQFVVSGWGPEEETLRSYGFPFERIRVGRLRGVSFPERVRTLLGLPGVFKKAMRILKEYQGEVVLGSGGHTAGPVVLAAVLLRIRRAIFEANATPGFTTRVLGPFVDRVYVGYPEGVRFFHRRKVLLSGVPVRSSIRQTLPKRGGDFTLLAFGGSHGAAAINQALLEAYPLLIRSGRPFRVIHVTGEKDFQTIRRSYESYGEPGKRVELFPFLREIGEAYGKTDLVLSRAGASTLAELIAAGRPALLVPYPHAASHHQRLNAQSFIEKGGGELLLNEELVKGGGKRLAEKILYYESHRELLAQMSERIGSLPGKDAAERIARDLIDLVRSRRRG